jgi:hypothetical protein
MAARDCAPPEDEREACSEDVALANKLRNLFTGPTAAAATADVDTVQEPLLPHLPTELLLQVVRHLSVWSLARLACTCRQFYYGPPCLPSAVEEELRRRAEAAGRWLPSSPPAGMSGWVPALLQREWRDILGVSTVAAGDSPHSLFVDANGALLVCGFKEKVDALGLPTDEDEHENEDWDEERTQSRTVLAPTPVPAMAGVSIRHVVAGNHCSLAVSEAGRVYMWGHGGYARLGSDEENQLVPTLIQELSHHRVRQVAIKDSLCAAVTEEGLLFTWGTAARHEDFDFDEAWDEEQERPQIGLGMHGSTINSPWPPQCVTALRGQRVGSVAVEMQFMLVTTEAGAVFSFGAGSNGSLGHGDKESHTLPKRVEALDGVYVAAVATGYRQSLALTACGRVFWCGFRLKYPTEFEIQLRPQLVDSAFGGGRVRSIAASFLTSYAVTDAGVLFGWGCDSYANDDNSPLSYGHGQVQLSPWPVAGLHGIVVVGVSVGHRHTLALAADGSVHAFGLGSGPGHRLGGWWARLP